MKTNITLLLRGGLGNQLFQAMAGTYYARKFSSKLYLDDVAIVRHSNYSRRSWLREIDLNGLFGEPSIYWENRALTVVRSFVKKSLKNSNFLEERQLDSLQLLERDITIRDWFQSAKFAPDDGLSLKRELLRNLSDEAQELARQVWTEDSAAIHVRLGDFKETSWGTLPDSWYQKTLQLLIERGIKSVHCFSDSIHEAKKMFEKSSSDCEVLFPETKHLFRPHELLWVLTHYKNYVSSNSSLSWWAAYLNRHSESLIVSPWGNGLHQKEWNIVR